MVHLNTFGKIFVVVLILLIPMVILFTLDPVADFAGICIEDICPDDFDLDVQRCFIQEFDTCQLIESINTGVIVTETDSSWRVTGEAVSCIRTPFEPSESLLLSSIPDFTLECFNIVIFDKQNWDRSLVVVRSVSGDVLEVNTFTLK